MHVIPHAMMEPGCCAFTQTQIGPFIDTLLDVDDLPNFGRLIVAESTVADWGQMFGMLPKYEVDRLRGRNAELAGQLAASEATVDHLRAALDSMKRAGFTTKEKRMPVDKPTPTEVENWVGPHFNEAGEQIPSFVPAAVNDDPGDETVEEVEEGTIDEVLAWVGDDPDRLTRAYNAELAGKNRDGLLQALIKRENKADAADVAAADAAAAEAVPAS